MDNQRLVESLLKKYRPGMELEIRLPATQDTFEVMYGELRSIGGTIVRTINLISDNVFEHLKSSTKYIRVFEYKDGVGTDSYYQKTNLGHVDNIKYKQFQYKLSLNDEQPCSQFISNQHALVRAKLRYSCVIDDWRFDITAVRQGDLSKISSQFVTIKKDLIETTPDNFLKQCIKFGKYEIELEYVGKQQPTVDTLGVVAKAIKFMGVKYEETATYDDELAWLSKLLGERRTLTFKLLMNQAEQLNKLRYLKVYPLADYYGVIKVDGERCFIHIDGNRCRVVRSNGCTELPCDVFTPGLVTCVDAEICDNIVYIIDVLCVDSKDVYALPFSERLTYMAKAGASVGAHCQVGVHEFVKLDDLKTDILKIANAKYPHPTDGIIFTQDGFDYKQTTNLKWKSFEHNTIDFLVKACPQSLIGKPPYVNRPGFKINLLFSNINHNMRLGIGLGLMQNYGDVWGPSVNPAYYPIQFSPSMDPLAYIWYIPSPEKDEDMDYTDKVVELCKTDSLDWKFVRCRSDKDAGNDFRIAEQTYINYIDRFNIEDLWAPPSTYFTQSKDKMHWASVKAMRLIVSLTLKERFAHSSWIIDLAGGRGADLSTWQNIHVSNLLAIDIDSSAISELLRRKYELKKHGGSQRAGFISPKATVGSAWNFNYESIVVKQKQQLTIHTLVADLSAPDVDLIASCRQYGISTELIDGINCSFGLHYLCNTDASITNILSFAYKMLRKGSVFSFTVMDGEKVFNLLKGITTWEAKEHEVTKFRIKKLYKGNTLSHSGQEISVKLPMSNEDKTEPLCNLTYVISVAKKMGFELTLRASFIDRIDDVESSAKHIYDKLTPDDKKYIELYSVVVLKKVK
jgi:hypothetical protein